MEKSRNEQEKAIALKTDELEQERLRTVDKIKAGLFVDSDK